MKDTILYICFSILLSTSCKKQSFQPDAIIEQCYDAKYQEEGYNIKTVIDDYQTLLVKEGILKDASGKSYLEVLQKISSDKDFRITTSTFMENDPFFKVDNDTRLAVFECERRMLESAKEEGAKWHTLNNFESPEIKENPDLVYQLMAETLSEEDFNSYYFRLKMFNLFDLANPKWGHLTMPTISTE